MKKYKSFMLSLLLVTLGITGSMATPIHASGSEDHPQVCEVIDCHPTNSFRATSVNFVKYSYGDFVEVASNTTGAVTNGEELSASITLTYSHSISGTISAAYDTVSAAVGFDVTGSKSLSTAYTLPLEKGKRGAIYARPQYKVHHVKLQRYWSGTLGCNFWKDSGTATVLEFYKYDYKTKIW